ncbi:MAG TPA: histidine kinase dimerization/phospho-acceptor domain-containing protein [Verrucomicrobiae bacterium]|nr:histidine kinase dimerization/phospho-acceptor domain-containing protein [Verrucomicrobiae bacterium]
MKTLSGPGGERLGPSPFFRLHDRLTEHAEALARTGDTHGAASLYALVEAWWFEQEAWNARVRDVLGVHHEINNALVGVRGNTQLMLMDPSGPGPGARERLEVVLRESGRIQEATLRLRDLKGVLGGSVPRSDAA